MKYRHAIICTRDFIALIVIMSSFWLANVCGRRVILAFVLVFLVLGGNADSKDFKSGDIDYEEIELVPTRKTKTERILQGIKNVFLPSSSSSSRSSGTRRKIGILLDSEVDKDPKPSSFGKILNLFEKQFRAIFPGTLWCGDGNVADSNYEVGLFKRTDACCQAHDKCSSNIHAGKAKGILLNDGIFTRSSCDCDQEFYDCLKSVKSIVSKKVGKTYFNILRPQCFSYDYPIKSCAKHSFIIIWHIKCIEYILDDKQSKRLQWFDNPYF